VILASGLVAHVLGLTVIVGGFMAGAVLPIRKPLFAIFDARLGDLTAAVLLPIFLAVSGLATDFRQLTAAAITGLLVLLAAGVASKWIGGAAMARVGGLSWHEGNVIGVLMNCRGLLVLVVALVGLRDGIITPTMQLGAVLMALITTAMTGPLFDATLRRVPLKVDV
jgi:Kef-type K+ transport system membrane component KefB